MKKLIIAIDGPVGSGKSTLARRVAELLGYVYVDTGAMYRALAFKALRNGLALDGHDDDLVALARETRIDLRADDGTQRVFLDHDDVTTAIRTPEVSQAASKIAVNAGVRQVLVAEQRRAGEQGGVVMEGRDIGSVVFPDAQLKIFLTASPETRAERRWREHEQKGDHINLQRTLEEIHERDRRDLQRSTSPLVRAADAVVVDSTAMEPEEVARLVVLLAKEQASANASSEPPQDRTADVASPPAALTRDWTSKRGIRRSSSFWRGGRAEAPWLPLSRVGLAPCAAPRCGSIHPRAAAVRLYAFQNG